MALVSACSRDLRERRLRPSSVDRPLFVAGSTKAVEASSTPLRAMGLSRMRPLRNEFGAASRRSLALGPGSHSAFAACARESRGGIGANPSTALSRKPATERSGVEGYPGPSAKTRAAPLTLSFAEVSGWRFAIEGPSPVCRLSTRIAGHDEGEEAAAARLRAMGRIRPGNDGGEPSFARLSIVHSHHRARCTLPLRRARYRARAPHAPPRGRRRRGSGGGSLCRRRR